MMGGPGGRMAFERETSKPKNTSETLRRFGHYLRPYWPVLLLALLVVLLLLLLYAMKQSS